MRPTTYAATDRPDARRSEGFLIFQEQMKFRLTDSLIHLIISDTIRPLSLPFLAVDSIGSFLIFLSALR